MPIKINSLNIRRLYTEEELNIANTIRSNNIKTEDIKRLLKLSLLPLNDALVALVNEEPSPTEVTLETLQGSFLTRKYYRRCEQYRDNKKVKKLDKFLKSNSDSIPEEFNEELRKNEELAALRSSNKELRISLNNAVDTFVGIRKLRDVYDTDLIGLSQSEMTDSMEIENYAYTDGVIIVIADQSEMMRQIVKNGFNYLGEKYILYTSSAGQLRKKKLMFVKEVMIKKASPRLTNGLPPEEINLNGGININKWSAYLALPVSSTTVWEGFDINRVCVVEDWETILKDREVDHINSKYEIERIKKDITIPHTDGFGMMHPSFCRDTRMVRAPWIKGLLAPFDFRSFVRTFNGTEFLIDIYGKKYHINDIDVILTKSQFKMWNFYDSWEHYKTGFAENGCVFRYMNSEAKKDLRLNAKFNYQMWNTLDIKDRKSFADNLLVKDKDLIKRAHYEVGAMLDVFHVDKQYHRNNSLQKSLYLYPSIMATKAFKPSLQDKIKKRKKEMKQGRIKVNGVYTYLIPDIFAWCENLFLGIENPKGLLKDGQVSCKLVSNNKDILVNRSPHLYVEHCVRHNIKNKQHIRWFIGKGVYTSSHDMISKQLFFDNDGDIALVVDNDEIVDIARDTMKNVVPLDFELSKAKPQVINSNNIYESYNLAFDANIGYYSNLITKVVNSDKRDFKLVAKICWINNQVIDYAKTCWKQEPTKELKEQLKELDNRRLPYFFTWAKDKTPSSVALPNENSVVDMMAVSTSETDPIRYRFSGIEKFDIENLLANVACEPIEELITHFKELSSTKYQAEVRKRITGDRDVRRGLVDDDVRQSMDDYLLLNKIDRDVAVDVLVKQVFETGDDRDTLFTIFGKDIVSRLENRFSELLVGTHTRCEMCGKRIEKTNGRVLMCGNCKKKKQKDWDRESRKRAKLKKESLVLKN